MSSSNFPELKPRIYDWNIDDEQTLINKIQSFTNDYTDQCNAVANNLTNFSHNLDIVEIDLYNSLNSLKTISLHKFIEHVVDNDEPIQKSQEEQVEPPLLTAEERNNLQIQLVQNAIKLSIDAIPVREPRQQQEENQEDDSVSVASSRLLTNQVAHFKNLKLPYIIGTKNFMVTEYVGLVPEEIRDDNVIEGVENTMQQVKEGNENEKEFVPLDNGFPNNDQQYQYQYQNQYQYQQPQEQMQYQYQQQQQYQQPQQQYQQPQMQPQPKMKGSIPVPPPMNVKIPKGGNTNNNNNPPMQNPAVYQQNIPMGNNNIPAQQQIQQPQANQGYQNNQPIQQQKEPEDVRTLLMRQMKERANPQPQMPVVGQENPANNYVNNNVQQNINPLPQSRTLAPQIESRQFRTGTMVGGKKEIRLGDFVKKSMFDEEGDDGDDDDFDPQLFKHPSRTIVDKNRFKSPPQNPMNYSQVQPQMMQQPIQQQMLHQSMQQQMLRNSMQQQMLQQPMQQQMMQQPMQQQMMQQSMQQQMLQQPMPQRMMQQPMQQQFMQPSVKKPQKKKNLFEDDNNDDVDINVHVPMKSKLDTTNTKKLGEKLLKFFGEDEDEEENENIQIEKIEEKTKLLAEKLKQINEEEKKEKEKEKIIPKKEEPKPAKVVKKPTFFDDDNDEEKPIKSSVPIESKPVPIKKTTTNENKPKPVSKIDNLPKRKGTFNLFSDPLQEKPVSSQPKKEEPKPQALQQPVQKKKDESQKLKNNFFLFGDDDEDDDKPSPLVENKKQIQQKPIQQAIKIEEPKIEVPKKEPEIVQKKEIIIEKPIIKQEVFTQPVEQKPSPQKQEPQKKLNPFEKMLAQKQEEERERQKQRENVQIKKVDFNSKFSDIQNVSSFLYNNFSYYQVD